MRTKTLINAKVWVVVTSMMMTLFGCELPGTAAPEISQNVDTGIVEVMPEEVEPEIFQEEIQVEEAEPEEIEPEILPEEEVIPEPEVLVIADPKLIVIDAGHQGQGNSQHEPIGPGATTTKAKVASGTTGRFTGVPEYILTLDVSLKLEEVLLAEGYEVVMIRSDHNVDISNAERAIIANDLNADAFIRIHANGSEDASVSGAFTLCQTSSNPYNGHIPYLYTKSRLLSDMVLDGFIDATGAKRRSIWETDTMSGINWCTIPTTIIEMGFMTNQNEDYLMQTQEYQWQMVYGMADGIGRYFVELEARGLA